MKIFFRRKVDIKSFLMSLFFLGFFIGIILLNIFRDILLFDTKLLDENTLMHLKYITLDSNVFFMYLLKERFLDLLIIFIFSTTYFGFFLITAYTLWLGVSAGIFFTFCIVRYGIKGFFLLFVGIFPQQFFYMPLLLFFFYICYDLCSNLYFQEYREHEVISKKNLFVKKRILQIIFVIFACTIACFLESHVNPKLLFSFLKYF